MNIDTLVVGPFDVNCYILTGCGNEAIVVDPGADAERIAERIEARGLAVALYLLTHGHIDHISALTALHRKFLAPVAIHPADLEWAFAPERAMPPFYPAISRPDATFIALTEGMERTDAGLTWRTIETPGHTPGGVCLLFPDEKMLLTGDTLFAGSVGRTDLPGASSRALGTSLKTLCKLPDDTQVYAGHGPATTLAQEKATNFFLRES